MKDIDFTKYKTIGFDIDDTITNSHPVIMKDFCDHYNVDYNYIMNNKLAYDYFLDNKDLFPNAKEYTKESYERLVPTVELKPNVKEAFDLLKEKGFKIVFITARGKDEYTDPYKISYDYLTKYNIPFDELYTDVRIKGKFCKENNIDLFIDDSIDNCNNALEYNIDFLIFDNIFNEKATKFNRLYNYQELIDELNKIPSIN